MHFKSLVLTAILLAQLNFTSTCQVETMLEELLLIKFIRIHRESDTTYYLFKNDYSENCTDVKFGNKTLVLSSKDEGNVFKILKVDFSGDKAAMEVLLENENLLLKGEYRKVDGKWVLESSSYIVT